MMSSIYRRQDQNTLQHLNKNRKLVEVSVTLIRSLVTLRTAEQAISAKQALKGKPVESGHFSTVRQYILPLYVKAEPILLAHVHDLTPPKQSC